MMKTQDSKFHTFGPTFKKMRETAGLSQQKVADALGYKTGQFLSNLERGRAAPPVSAIAALSFLYSVPTTTLMGITAKIANQKLKCKMQGVKLTRKERATISRRMD